MANTFQDGDLAIVIDSRSRRFMVRLGAGRVFHTHHGHLAHDDIIGQEEGSRLKTQMDREMVVLRPSLADYILKMPRQSQVIYPKDIGPMLVSGDIHPGARVVEAGMGSGAMSMALLRAIGPMGRLTTYEVREDLATQALRNVEAFMPGVENFILRHADVYEGIEERDVNRVVLDLPEPWRAIRTAADALRPGGILLSYLPTTIQIHRLYEAIADEVRFDLVEAFEVMQRPWHLAPTSARPAHRMVAHTGFIVKTVRCEARARRQPRAGPDEID